MKLLLDTHAVLWWLADDDRLGRQARKRIADPRNDILVSVVSLWEIVVKQRVGKLRLDVIEVVESVRRGGFKLLEISVPHLVTLEGVPSHHRDPFDHLLIAQAISESATLISDDKHIPQYAVSTIPCSGAARRVR